MQLRNGRASDFPDYLKMVPTVYGFKFSSSSFFVKMAYRRICGDEVVHTSVQEIYTELWVESRFPARKRKGQKGKRGGNKNRSASAKPPCKN